MPTIHVPVGQPFKIRIAFTLADHTTPAHPPQGASLGSLFYPFSNLGTGPTLMSDPDTHELWVQATPTDVGSHPLQYTPPAGTNGTIANASLTLNVDATDASFADFDTNSLVIGTPPPAG